MKLRSSILLCVISHLLFGACNKHPGLIGNFYSCHDGRYAELYFREDSMRISIKNEWGNVSEWRKFETKGDTIFFETFGEWKEESKAEIIYEASNRIKLKSIADGETIHLESINKKLDLENSEEFWREFEKRQKNKNCKE